MMQEAAWTPERISREQIVITALCFIFEDETHQQAMPMLRADGEPVDVLAQTTVAIVRDVIQHRGRVPSAAIVPAGSEVLNMLAELARVAGLFDAENDAHRNEFGKATGD